MSKIFFRECRSDVKSFHNRIYTKAVMIAESIDVQESIPHLASRQQHRSNIQAANFSDYYCLNLTIPFIDHMLSELDTRFDESSCSHLAEFLLLLPSTVNTDSEASIEGLQKLYESDLPHPTATLPPIFPPCLQSSAGAYLPQNCLSQVTFWQDLSIIFAPKGSVVLRMVAGGSPQVKFLALLLLVWLNSCGCGIL